MQRFLTVTLLLVLAASLTAWGPPASNARPAGEATHPLKSPW